MVIDDRKSKSFEEREEQYVEARNRIFHQQHSSVSDSYWLTASSCVHANVLAFPVVRDNVEFIRTYM